LKDAEVHLNYVNAPEAEIDAELVAQAQQKEERVISRCNLYREYFRRVLSA
jgi:hypothetical protein